MKLKVLITAALLTTTCWGCSLFYSDYQKDIQATALAQSAVKYAAAGQKEQALSDLDDAFALAKTTIDEGGEGGYEHSNALSKIAINYTKSGFYDQALIVANTISRDNTKKDTLSKITQYHTRVIRYDQAVALANTIEINSVKSGNLLENTPDNDPKILQYEQDLTVANKIKNSQQKAMQLVQIAVHFLNTNQTDEGLQLLDKAFNLTKSTDNRYDEQALDLSEIAVIYAHLGEYDRALTVANSIQRHDAFIKAKTLTYIKNRQNSYPQKG